MASFAKTFQRASLTSGRLQALAKSRTLASLTSHGNAFSKSSFAHLQTTSWNLSTISTFQFDRRLESTLADKRPTPKAANSVHAEVIDAMNPEAAPVNGSDIHPRKPIDIRDVEEADDWLAGPEKANANVSQSNDPLLPPDEAETQSPPLRTAAQRNRRLRQPRAASQWSSRFYSPPPSRRRNRYQRNHHLDSMSAIMTPVESVHIAQSINLEKVFQNVFPERRPRLKFPTTNYFVVRLGSIHRPRYVAVFGYGSVVFFDIAPKDVENLLREIRQYGTDVVPAGTERREIFKVEIQPHLQGVAHVVNGDLCVVPALDMDCVAVIANIMAQTVALDAYSRTVENLLQSFANINTKVTQSGSFTELEKNTLFRTVAQNNSIVIDLISKLGIKDRSDTAWNLSQYEQVHSGLKEEFEIDNRFDLIEFKLNLIQQNAKFFLEVLHHQKANTLEWIIVVLIAFECSLMMLDMTGYGSILFEALRGSSEAAAALPPSSASSSSS